MVARFYMGCGVHGGCLDRVVYLGACQDREREGVQVAAYQGADMNEHLNVYDELSRLNETMVVGPLGSFIGGMALAFDALAFIMCLYVVLGPVAVTWGRFVSRILHTRGCLVKKHLGKAAVVAGMVGVASAVHATGFADAVTVDTTPVLTLAGVVLTAIGGIWAIRKCIKLMNRS